MRTLKCIVSSALSAIFLCSVSFAASPDRINGTLTGGAMVPLAGNIHAKAQAQYDQGPVDPSFRLDYVTMLFQPSAAQREDLEKLLTDQQDPSSPNYHHWLTAKEFGNRFGLSQNDIGKISAWLKSQGFKIVSVANGGQFIVFGGTAAQIENTFQTQIHRYNV
ncbi:MAG: protease pro-enzyme activation domain-containing protein, partial [Candidatus Sulfotelmatobacter sp.]